MMLLRSCFVTQTFQKKTLADGTRLSYYLSGNFCAVGTPFVISEEIRKAFHSMLAKWAESKCGFKSVKNFKTGESPICFLYTPNINNEFVAVCQVHVKCPDTFSI